MTVGRSFGVLWRACGHLRSLSLANDSRSNVDEPHDASNDAVSDGTGASVVRKQKAKTAVDDPERDDEPSKPDVSVRPEGSALVLLEELVVNYAERGHEKDENQKENTDNCVVRVKLLGL